MPDETTEQLIRSNEPPKSSVLWNRMKTPEQVLIDAKLAGTVSPSSVPMHYTYLFRNNEQAAKLAIRALEDAGYKIVIAKRTIVENYETYVCEKCGATTTNKVEGLNFLAANTIECYTACGGTMYTIEEANKRHEEDIASRCRLDNEECSGPLHDTIVGKVCSFHLGQFNDFLKDH